MTAESVGRSRSDTPVAAVITTMMLAQRISCLPVVEEGRLQGIITTSDLLMVLQCVLRLVEQQALPADSVAETERAFPSGRHAGVHSPKCGLGNALIAARCNGLKVPGHDSPGQRPGKVRDQNDVAPQGGVAAPWPHPFGGAKIGEGVWLNYNPRNVPSGTQATDAFALRSFFVASAPSRGPRHDRHGDER